MSDPEEHLVDWTTVYRYHVHRLCYNNWVVLYFFNDLLPTYNSQEGFNDEEHKVQRDE